jgi:glycosyltransferase involved in cell wall biosynthesis
VVAAERLPPQARVVPATAEHSSYHARNVGAEAARSPWLLFVDSDTVPARGILDAYFAEPPPERSAILAGGVTAAAQRSRIARYARSRGHLDESFHISTGPFPAGITANLLVRRAVWESVGGFHEGVRSGADVEFCWRVQELGWELVHRPQARVEHLHVEKLRPLLRKSARYGAGRLWVDRRYRGSFPRPRVAAELVRAAGGSLVWMLTLRFERALFKLVDAAVVLADLWGYVAGDNRAARSMSEERSGGGGRGGSVLYMTDAYPARSETFVYNEVAALRDLGWRVRVESSARPSRVERSVARSGRLDYLEDDSPRAALRDFAWLALRHPLRCLRDVAARRRWAREEEAWPLRALAPAARRLQASGERHIHVHFAAGAALHALRLARLVGVGYSVVGHGYDVFQKPRNLAEKLRRASFVVGPCEYTAAYLRALLPASRHGNVHVVVMGVDGARFRRASPYPGGRSVVAIGRLVSKKGFGDLIEAAGRLAGTAPLERLAIAGDGPLRDELEARIARLGLDGTAALVDAWGADGVRPLLESADVLAMPSVIAPDGDRDAMPVVVKEALAMEIPVVCTDEVGLPELVRPEWGRLVPTHDPEALAAAIGELLALAPERRARMGAAGRTFVLERCDLRRETVRLAELIVATTRG